MRFVFSPPGEAELLDLPWGEPLEGWRDERLVEIRQRGLSRHVVRFASAGGALYALKELDERLARREYRLLRRLRELGLPVVEPAGIVVERAGGLDAVLVTRFLVHSISYRVLFSGARGPHPTDRLVDALVELLVRLHLAGFMWGDCSLSNVLFRMDAGAYAAYLVDAETAELHPPLSPGQRRYDVDLAFERIGGELFDLRAAGSLPERIDPVDLAGEVVARYEALWDELTREEVIPPEEERRRVAERLRRVNELGFDVDEVELITTGGGSLLRIRTTVAEPGRHRAVLLGRTGLAAEENQARRLLNDMAAYRAHLERRAGRPVPEVVASARWLTEVYEPVLAAVPPDLRGRLDGPELFHEILEHRWFLSERSGKDVGTPAATRDYLTKILPTIPPDLTADPLPDPRDGGDF